MQITCVWARTNKIVYTKHKLDIHFFLQNDENLDSQGRK